MAIGTPVLLGTNTAASTGSSPNIITTLTLTTGAAVGNHVVLFTGNAGVAAPAGSVTDSRGNTWSSHQVVSNGTAVRVKVWTCKVTTALQVGDTIVANYGTTNPTREWMRAVSVSGLDQTTWYGGIGNTAASTDATPTTNIASVPANCILIGCVGTNDSGGNTISPGTGYTAVDVTEVSASFNQYRDQYQINPTPGTVTFDASNSGGSSAWAIAGVALNEGVAAGATARSQVVSVG